MEFHAGAPKLDSNGRGWDVQSEQMQRVEYAFRRTKHAAYHQRALAPEAKLCYLSSYSRLLKNS